MTDPKNIVRSHDLVWRHLAGVELDAQDRLRTTDEQEKNALRRIDHIGLGCRDAETTRHFYEDILGMPLVLAMVMPDPYRDDRQEHCHFFFEVGSGTCLSFFDHPRAFTEDDFRPCTGMLRHIAIEVAEDQLVQDFRERLEQAGVTARYIDHDVQHSLYFTDPNGHNLEITFRPASNAEFMGKSRKVARQVFEGWTANRASYPTLRAGDA